MAPVKPTWTHLMVRSKYNDDDMIRYDGGIFGGKVGNRDPWYNAKYYIYNVVENDNIAPL